MNMNARLVSSLLVVLALASRVQAGCVVSDVTCYVDDEQRVLGSTNMNSMDKLFNEYCAQICHDNGNTLAGSEYGVQCYCGDTLRPDAKKAPMSECNMPCAGYPDETCGAGWRISVFTVNCSGTPVPPPPESPYLVNPCRNATGPYVGLPFCDSSLSLDDRVEDALARLTLQEKIDNLGTDNAGFPSLGVPKYNWWSEATHGVASGRNDEKTPWATNFAFPITTAMSFNRSLWWHTGSHIGREARAYMNAGNGYSTFWAPVINLARDPRWGRNIETPGEDPYLSGEYASAFVKGMQESPDDPYHIQASACCKHYIANEMDDSTEVGVHHWRNEFNAEVGMQDMVDSYMVPFQACVEKGRVSGLMCSYNAVNGIPACADDWLLTTVARGEWGFDGYITSDCDADDDVFNSHHYTATAEEAVRDVLRAGTDVDCGGFVQQHAQSALDSGNITTSDIDTRIRFLLRLRFRLGHFDPPSPLDRITTAEICSDYALELARDGTTQSATLLKNAGATLPLDRNKIKKVAVIGPNALLSQSIAGYYGPGKVCGNNFWTVNDAIAQYAATTVMLGVPDVSSNDTSGIPAAVALAKSVDAVVLAVGTDLSLASEGHDTSSIELSQGQQALISAVAAAVQVPVVVITLTAVPLDISDLLDNTQIGAILHAGQPSVATLGLGDLVFGEKVPAGRTVQTILPKSYASSISIFDMGMRPGPSNYPRPDCPQRPAPLCPNATNPGRTYRFYTGDAVVPFGFGLSYTTFEYTIINAPKAPVSLDRVRELLLRNRGSTFVSQRALDAEAPLVAYAVNVTNTGNYDAADAVLGFIVPPGAGQGGVPLQVLFGFDRVWVPKGETVTVWLLPAMLEFTQVNEAGQRVVWPGDYTVQFGVQETQKFGQGFAKHTVTMV